MQVITSLNAAASAAGLHVGQPVRDAHAMCAGLVTRAQNTVAEGLFLTVLRRWAGKFSPWVSEAPPDGLVVDLSGCAHLFGGEEMLVQILLQDCADMGLTVCPGIADTLGAAWALAHYAGHGAVSHRSGDAIDQEARATRARATRRRHWTKGGAAPAVQVVASAGRIAAPGQTYTALSPLPVAALRLQEDVTAQLGRLGLRQIGDLLGQPRAGLARRFGKGLVLRLDQAMGSAPEPVSPARVPDSFAFRLTFPDPIGLEEDILAGVDRLLPRLCDKLRDAGRGARAVQLEAHCSDGRVTGVEVRLARPGWDVDRLRPLLAMKLPQIEAGFGIDMLRLVAVDHEPVHVKRAVGHLQANTAARARLDAQNDLDDLIAKIGARVGLEVITRKHPVSSHIPEKSSQVLAAAWSEPAGIWPRPSRPRPLMLWRPEAVTAADTPLPPAQFRWRGRGWDLTEATGPERIAPEWWLDEPDWRSGVRDYWVVTTGCGQKLWLYYAYGATMSAGWFSHGSFS